MSISVNKTNTILLCVNLLLLGLLLGMGLMPRLYRGDGGTRMPMPPRDDASRPPPPFARAGQQFGPDFQQKLSAAVEAAEPDWKVKITAARSRVREALAADPFQPDAFRAATADFDRLMDEFHSIMQSQVHEHLLSMPTDERRHAADMLQQMPLPLVDQQFGGAHGEQPGGPPPELDGAFPPPPLAPDAGR